MSFNFKYPQIYLFFLFTAALISCKDSSRPDVSGIKLQVKIERFDLDLYAGRGKAVAAQDQLLSRKYGNFYEDYIHRMVGTPEYTGEEILSTLYKDKAYADLNREKDSVFKDLKVQEQGLTETFRYIKYYFPKIKVPRFISFISGFAVQAPLGDDYMGIGLDMFLGKDSQFYGAIVQSVPRYLSKRFAPEYIVPRITETYLREELFPEADEDRTLLSKMIHNGKILYFMDQVLPEDLADTVKIGYTGKQLNWCATYEGDIWAYLISNNLLYETDEQKIQVYVSEGPFTPGLGEKNESAPKLGSWIGWQIVRKYMDAHPELSLPQLMAEQDAQAILQGSKYKPKSGK